MKVRNKLVMLFSLYFVQGLPYGFYSIALPLYLRSAGVSLTTIGSSSLLSLPWVFKALWSPLVDRQKGNRKSWIIPTQIGMTICCIVAALFPITTESSDLLLYFLSFVFLTMNMLAATQDVAVDGLAIDLITRDDLGPANAFQVVGFKCGMFLSGLVIVRSGWAAQFLLMAAITGIVLSGVAIMLDEAAEHAEMRAERKKKEKEKELRDGEPSSSSGSVILKKARGTRGIRISDEEIVGGVEVEEEESAALSFTEVSRKVLAFLKLPIGRWLLIVVGTYKLGDTIAGTMLKTYFLDIGFSKSEVATWFGSFGLFTSIIGSFFGGFLASKLPFRWALLASSLLRLPTSWLIYWLSASTVYSFLYLYEVSTGSWGIILVLSIDSFFNGMITPIVFAYMMSKVDRRIGATHYTLLASVEVAGKLVAMALSGWLVDRFGYQRVFLLGALASTAFVSLLLPFFISDTKRKQSIY